MTKSHSSDLCDLTYKGYVDGADGYALLYKYQTINEYSLDALRNGYVYFSKPEQLNDPMDPLIDAMLLDNPLLEAMKSKGTKIFCLTEDPLNPAMWGYYGNSAKGMCIGYPVSIGNLLLFQPVQYLDDFNNVGYPECYLLKGSAWAHEKEWRAVIPNPDHKLTQIVKPYSVFLGPNCSTSDALLVKGTLPKSVAVFQKVNSVFMDRRLALALTDVDQLIEHYGELPSNTKFMKDLGTVWSIRQ